MKIPVFLSVLAVCAALNPSSQAITSTWIGGGSNTNWSTPENWQGNTIPISAADTIIVLNPPNSVSSGTNMNLGSSFQLNRLEILGGGTNNSSLNIQGGMLHFVANAGSQPMLYSDRAATSNLNNAIQIDSGAMLTLNLTTYHLILNGPITGSGGIDKSASSGGIDLRNSGNTFSGGLIIRGNNANWNKVNVTASGAMGTGTVQLHGGTLDQSFADPGGLIFMGNTTHSNQISLHQNSPIFAGLPNSSTNQVTLTGGISLNQHQLYLRGGGVGNAEGIITGTGGIIKRDSGNWALKAQNTYTGATVIENGVLTAQSIANGGVASSIGQSGNEAANLRIQNGTLRYTGPAASTDRRMTLQNTATFDIAEGSSLTFTDLKGSSVNGNTVFVKQGAGDLTFSVSGAAYTGQSQAIHVLEGRLLGNAQYNANRTTPDGDAIVLGDGVTMAVPAVLQTTGGNTTSQTLRYIGTTATATLSGPLTLAGNSEKIFEIQNGASDVDLLMTGSSTTWEAGVNTRIVKRGEGTMSVTNGNQVYAGGVRIEQGGFLANNTSGSATGSGEVRVVSQGFLGGKGLISGNTIIENGGVLTPGETPNAPGTLSFGSNLIFGVDAESNFQIRAANSTVANQSQIASLTDPGDQALNDLVKVANAVTFDGLINLDLENYNPGWGDVIDLFDFNASSGALPDFNIVSGSLGAYTFDTSRFMDLGVLVVVPEPSKGILGLLSLASLTFLRRRTTA